MANQELTDSILALQNDDKPLGVSSLLGPRLRGGLNVSDLINHGGATFEVDADADEPERFDDDREDALESDLFLAQFSQLSTSTDGQKKHDVIYKSIDAAEAIGHFDEILERMENLTEDGKVKKLIVKKGTGKNVPQDGKLWFDYIAFAEGKDGEFDSTLNRGYPEAIALNQPGCIKGLEIGLKSMEYDEIAKFWIHYDYAYGKHGSPPRIPSEASVLWTVELRQVASAEQLQSCVFMTADERNRLPFQEVLKAANELKSAANTFYAHGKQYREAIKRYRKALELLEDYATLNKVDDAGRNEVVFTIYVNLAQSYLKESLPKKACLACRAALRLPVQKPELAYKLYFRYAKAKFELGDKEGAMSLAKKAKEISPKIITDIEAFINQVDQSLAQDAKKESSMYRKMFGN